MRFLGVALIVLAIALAVVPQFTDCHSQGRMLTLQNGRTVDMKCHWTAMAALGLAIPLAGVGALLALNRRKDTSLRSLGVMGALLGAVAILLPTLLIGVCASNEMLCNSVMRPLMILIGTLAIVAAGAAALVGSRKQQLIPAV